jgi:hypothetical protein
MIQGQAYSFTPNPGYILYQASDLELASLREEVEQIAENRGQGWQSAQSVLVGSIEHEYHLTASRNDVFNLVLPLAQQYVREFNYQSKIDRLGIRDRGQPLELGLGGLWVNYQQRGEFNPVHQHDGVFSFVIWLQIQSMKNSVKHPDRASRPAVVIFTFITQTPWVPYAHT